jgi:hypothetical protein
MGQVLSSKIRKIISSKFTFIKSKDPETSVLKVAKETVQVPGILRFSLSYIRAEGACSSFVS